MTNPHHSRISRRLIILGSTGSIGVSALEVVRHLTQQNLAHFEIVGLAAGNNQSLLLEQAQEFKPAACAVASDTPSAELRQFSNCYCGPNAALELIESIAQAGDLVLGAMVGSAGVPPTLAAIERGCDIALANKETLVAAGELVVPLIRTKDVRLLPVDSEHSAIAQCLRAGRSIEEVRRVVLTASGGPFRTWPGDRIESASVADALNHPTWNMGQKITIDSASMMNKALEIIEAHWLFGLPPAQIEVVVHPQSIVHSFVEFVDGSVMAQLGPPDMRTPIQYALTFPDRVDGCSRSVAWADLRSLDFEPVDHERFPAVRMAHTVIERGGSAGAIFNAANETAVQAFLNEQIAFGEIARLTGAALNGLPATPIHTLEDVIHADRNARRFVSERIEHKRLEVARTRQ